MTIQAAYFLGIIVGMLIMMCVSALFYIFIGEEE